MGAEQREQRAEAILILQALRPAVAAAEWPEAGTSHFATRHRRRTTSVRLLEWPNGLSTIPVDDRVRSHLFLKRGASSRTERAASGPGGSFRETEELAPLDKLVREIGGADIARSWSLANALRHGGMAVLCPGERFLGRLRIGGDAVQQLEVCNQDDDVSSEC